MRTPEEIKEFLSRCEGTETEKCMGCRYCIRCDYEDDALEYIQQLESRIDTLTAKAVLFDEAIAAGGKYKRERDAAIMDIPRSCKYCKNSL